MAVTQIYSAVPNDVITAARWNNEFGNIYNNGTDIAFPLTKAVSFAGYTITLDSSGVTTIISPGTTGLTFTPGAKSGTPGTTGGVWNTAANTFTDSATAASGTAAVFTATTLQRPTLAATNTGVTTTDAATHYITNSPLAGTNETITNAWSQWIDSGNCRYDGNVQVQGDTIISVNPYRFTATVSGNALTITLQDVNGNTPTASSPIPLAFRNATIATPQLSTVLVTAATTLVISSGSTLGTVSGRASRIWIGALNNAGTVELFAVNNVVAAALGAFPQAYSGPSVLRLRESDLITTTAEGGAGGADTAQIPYSTTARTNVAFRWLGYVESTQSTAGTWASAPSRVQMIEPGIVLPGEIVQRVMNFDNNVATGTTAIPHDNTTPLITEGDQYMSQAITPTFAGNIVHVWVRAFGSHSASVQVIAALNDGTSVLAAALNEDTAAGAASPLHIDYYGITNTVSATTWAVRMGSAAGATFTFNGNSGAVRLNILCSQIGVEEIQV